MRSPLDGFELLVVDQALSTQDLAAAEVGNAASLVGAVLTTEQVAGRGRLQREWITPPGEALTVSLIFRAHADHPSPWLLGMAVAVAAAGALHAHVQWPNDLVLRGRKVGGILTELYRDAAARQVAVVGLGVNLNQASFPESIADRALSLYLFDGVRREPEDVLEDVLRRLELLREPLVWADLAPAWAVFDQTAGKKYRLPSGEEAVALGIGRDGELIASLAGTPVTVLAADAILG